MVHCNERRTYLFLLFFLCLISFGLGYYLFKYTAFKEIRPVPVTHSLTLNVQKIIPKDITVQKNYVGRVEAINLVQIIPYVSGYLQNILVKEGQYICKGDMMFTIDPGEYKAVLDAKEAAIIKAEANFEYNKNFYDRIQKSGNKAFSEIDIDNARNAFLQSEAELKNAIANRDAAQVNYQRTFIKAPISGLIGNFNLSVGDYVSPDSDALLSIVQTNPIKVVFSLTDVEYLNMKEDNTCLFKDTVIKLKTANGNFYPLAGKFKYTDNQINPKTNSLAIYTYFKNKDNILFTNSFVTVVLEKTFKDTVLINKNFIFMEEKGSFINIVRNNTIVHNPVEIITDKNDAYILKNTFISGDLLLTDEVKNIPSDAELKFNLTD